MFSAATTRALDTWKLFKADNWISSGLIPIKEAKSFGWIKEHALWGPNSQILATPEQSFPELKRIPKHVNTGVENGLNP